MRLALKQLAGQQVRKQNQDLGALLLVVNSISEKADARNWQSLPTVFQTLAYHFMKALTMFNKCLCTIKKEQCLL